MSKTKKIAILAIIAMVLTLMPTALFAATADSNRLSGDTRIATALDIASAGWTTASTVVLAPADQANLVDALAAAPLAGQENAPILLTDKGSLDASVKAKIAALGATKVYVVGAISDAVAAEVDAIANVTVEALKGAGRQATAAAVNAKLTSPAGTFVVGYDAIPDALSVASYAAKNKYAIVLANQDGSVASTLVGTQKYIVGGTAKVADIAGVARLSGENRYATNADVASKLSFSYDRVYVANGISLVDALAVAPLAAKYNAFVALASGSEVSAASVLNAKLSATSKVIAVGGVNAVPAAVVGQVAYAAPAAFAVTGAETIGLSQIKVTFSKEADKDTAEIEGNYSLGGAALGAPAIATLAADKKSVMIYLDGTAPKAQYAKEAFKVSGAIFSKDLQQKNATYNADLTFSDVTVPTVASVTASGNKRVDVKFSEAVDIPAGYTTWKIDGQTVSNFGYTSTDVTGGNVFADVYKLNFGVALAAGTHTLTIPAGSAGTLVDGAGFKVAETSVEFTVNSVTTKPSIVSVEASDNGAVYVTFDRKMSKTSVETTGKYLINDGAVATATVKADTEDKVVKLTKASLPIGANTIVFDYTLEDSYGNKLGSSDSDDVRMSFTVVKDTVKPTISSVTMTTPTTVVVKYSESVNASYGVNTANYTLKDSTGNPITITGITGTTDTYTLAVGALQGSNYSLKIKNVVDLAANPNTMDEAIFTFSAVDETKPTITKIYKQTDSAKKVAVYYSEAMDTATTTVATNYTYEDSAGTERSLPSGTTLQVGETAKIVIITFPTSYTTDTASAADAQYEVAKITAMNVKDAAGNLLNGVTQEVAVTDPAVDAANGPDYVVNSLKLFADSSKVWAEFETTQTITDLRIADFTIANQAPDSGYVVGKKVVLNFTDATLGGKIDTIKGAGILADLDTVALNSTNSIGVKVNDFDNKVVYDDQIAPKYVSAAVNAGAKTVTLTFTEDIDGSIAGLYNDDFTFEVGGTPLNTTTATVGVATNTVTWTFAGAIGVVDTVTIKAVPSKINIRDKMDASENYNVYVPVTDDTNGSKTATMTAGAVITGLAVPANTLQVGEGTQTAATAEAGATGWTSSNTSVATVVAGTGVITPVAAGTTTISYTSSTSGKLNQITVTVYAAATVVNPTYAVGATLKADGSENGALPTNAASFAPAAGQALAFASSDAAKVPVVAGTGAISDGGAGAIIGDSATISYELTDVATGVVLKKGSLLITLD